MSAKFEEDAEYFLEAHTQSGDWDKVSTWLEDDLWHRRCQQAGRVSRSIGVCLAVSLGAVMSTGLYDEKLRATLDIVSGADGLIATISVFARQQLVLVQTLGAKLKKGVQRIQWAGPVRGCSALQWHHGGL